MTSLRRSFPLVSCSLPLPTPAVWPANTATALETGTKIWVGIWNTPADKFNREKAALEAVMRRYPDTSKWLMGINVGSESLYRKDVTPAKLAEQIYG